MKLLFFTIFGLFSLIFISSFFIKSTEARRVYAGYRNNRYQPRFIPSPTPKVTPKPTTKPSPSPTPKASPTPSASPLASPSSALLFGVAINDYANKQGELSSLQNILGKKISTISIFKQFGLSGNKDLVSSDLTYLKSQGMKLQVAWEPWNPEQGNSQSIDYLKQIPTGKYDSYIISFAAQVKNFGGTVSLRFGHEMNGDWYPWGKRPTEYIAAYRYIHDLFVKENVSNVNWMWCVNVFYDSTNLAQYYPGDDVVDIISIDGFNWGTTSNSGWQSFTTVFGPTYDYLSGKYNKPIIIAETASTELGGDKAKWVKDMLSSELPTRFPKVKELIWFQYLKETDWRINSSGSTLKAFQDTL